MYQYQDSLSIDCAELTIGRVKIYANETTLNVKSHSERRITKHSREVLASKYFSK